MDLKVNFDLISDHHPMKLEEEIAQKKFRSNKHKLSVNLIYTYNWLNSFYQKVFKDYHITPQQFNLLRILRGQHPNCCTIKLLKDRMLDKMSDASRIVEKLVAKQLVERYTDEQDRRKCKVHITEKGLELLAAIDKREPEFYNFFSAITEEEAATINALLDKLRD
ncbi:MAG: hypothetical protein RIQ89_1120 [Bacteroidota bacterium]|jgi:DNA-binding MarR family transcriptional regulator